MQENWIVECENKTFSTVSVLSSVSAEKEALKVAPLIECPTSKLSAEGVQEGKLAKDYIHSSGINIADLTAS